MYSPSARGALVVTGGTRGIGAAIAQRAAAEGQALALLYRSRDDEAHTLADALRKTGVQVGLYRADVERDHIVQADDISKVMLRRCTAGER